MTWRSRIYFLCGQLGLMALVRFLLSWTLKFGDQKAPDAETLLGAAAVGAALFLFRVFDAVTDPLAGAVGDGWVAAGRERRTLLWFSLGLPPVGLALSFAASFSHTPSLRWGLYLVGMTIFFVGYTFYAIPYWSLVGDLAGENVGERRTLSTLLGLGLMLASAVVGVASPFVIHRLGYFYAALAFAAPAALFMVLPYYASPAPGRRRAAPRRSADESARSVSALLRGVVTALRHRRFLAFLLLFSGSQMAFTVITAGLPFLAEGLLGGTERDVALLMAPFLLTAIPAFAFAPRLSRRFGWERVGIVASIGLAVVYAGTAFFGSAVLGTPMRTAQVLFACGGPLAALVLGVEAEAITECAREAGGEVQSLYWGVFNFMIKGLNGAAAALTGLLAGLSHRPDIGRAAVRAMGPLAGGLLVLGVACYFVARVRPGSVAASPPDAR